MKKTKFASCRCGKEFPQRLLSAFEADFSNRSALWSDEAWAPQCMLPAFFDVLDVAVLYEHRELLSKYRAESKDSRKVLALKAIDKFLLVEERLKTVNERLVEFPTSTSADCTDTTTDYSDCLRRAELLIMNLIGYWLPDQKQLLNSARFGPGSTLDGTRATRDVYFKLRRWPYAYPRGSRGPVIDAIVNDDRWYHTLIGEIRNLADDQFKPILMDKVWNCVLHPVVANRVTTVPKNCETDRTIAIEPLMGIYLQLGVDGFIRRRLKTVRIDLDDQELNASAALAASKDDDLATLDLSSASDSVCIELVRTLLPAPWFEYLSSLRARFGILPDGRVIEYQKFSSMGNGFTFALESLIFWALASSCVPKRLRHFVYTYGDDIIVPSSCVDHVIGLLTYVGFEVNKKKTFTDGPFRESCGMNAWNGSSVNPVRLHSTPRTVSELADLYNQFFLWYHDNVPDRRFCDSAVAREILSHVPTGALRWGPCVRSHLNHWFYADSYVQVGTLRRVLGYAIPVKTGMPTDFAWGRLKSSLRGTTSADPYSADPCAGSYRIPLDESVDTCNEHLYEVFPLAEEIPDKYRVSSRRVNPIMNNTWISSLA